MEVVRMVDAKRAEQRDHRVPRVGAPCNHDVAAHLARRTIGPRRAGVNGFIIGRRGRRKTRRVEHTNVARESRSYEPFIDPRNDSGCHRITGIDQKLEPLAKALRIELSVAAGSRTAPQVEVEDGRQLLWGCQRIELAARIESALPNELMERLGRKVRHNSRED